MEIRCATIKELDDITCVESLCFPASEAASKDEFEERIKYYGNHFWLLYEANKLISFVDGMATNKPDLEDDMYLNAAMHNENGLWQMIFGDNTIPTHRHQGYAAKLIKCVIDDAYTQGRKGVVLTCKESLIEYYNKFGFKNEGISKSVHGNVIWYQMRLEFDK